MKYNDDMPSMEQAERNHRPRDKQITGTGRAGRKEADKTVSILFRTTPEMKARLETVARLHGQNNTAIITAALSKFLAQETPETANDIATAMRQK